jgi:small subunit ribosomal protein S9
MPETILATGRRKESVARIYLKPGTGQIKVNKRTVEDYFPRLSLQIYVREPLEAASQLNKYDIAATVDGGGISGQAGAVRLGIARALVKVDENLRQVLRKSGFLTRDPRAKERKKYGQKGARRRFQWTKR